MLYNVSTGRKKTHIVGLRTKDGEVVSFRWKAEVHERRVAEFEADGWEVTVNE